MMTASTQLALLVPLLSVAVFALGRASARATWRRIDEARAEMATFEELAQRWRQHSAPVPEWPAVLPEGDGVREPGWATERARELPVVTPSRRPFGVARHRRRRDWAGFWAATTTPRDLYGRALASWPVLPLPEAVQLLAGLHAPTATATAAQVLEATWGPARELVGAAT